MAAVSLDAFDRQALRRDIKEYRRGWLALVLPMTLRRHFQAKAPHPYSDRQYCLEPHPRELLLLHHV